MSAQLRAVTADEADIRLDRWFRRHFPQATQGVIQKLCRTGQVRVDGHRAAADTRLAPGQSVRVPPLPAAPPVEQRAADPADAAEIAGMVVWRDEQVIVLNKPQGLPTQGGPGITHHVDRLLEALRLPGGDRPRLVHRLDRETSGLLVVARTPGVAARLAAAFRSRAVEKTYWAVVAGRPVPVEGRIERELVRTEGFRGERAAVAGPYDTDTAHSITDYRTLDHAGRKLAWLELRPLTGRTHQLRVHCASSGAPILGDRPYGTEREGRNTAMVDGLGDTLHLLARRLVLPHPAGGSLAVEAPLPAHMARTFATLGFHRGRSGPAGASPMKRAAAVLFVLLLVAAGVVAAGWFGVDALRGRVAVVAARAVHRPVQIGQLVLLPAWPPLVQARDVSVTGFGRVARVDASIVPASLFSGRPRLDTITLVRPDIVLPADLTRLAVRRAPAPAPLIAVAANGTVPPVAAPEPRVDVSDGHVAWRDPATGAGVDLSVSGGVAAGQASFVAHGTLFLGSGSAPLSATVAGSPKLLPGESLHVEGMAGAARITLAFVRPAAAAPVAGTLAIAAPDGAAWGQAFGLHLPPGPLQLQAQAQVEPQGRTTAVAIDRVALQSGAGDLAGTLRLLLGSRDELRGTLAAQHLDLDRFLAALRIPAAPHAVAGAPEVAAPHQPSEASARHIIPDERLMLPPHLDLDLDLSAAELVARGTAFGAFSTHLVVAHGRLAMDPIQVTPQGGAPAQAALHYGAATGPSSLSLRAPSVPLAPLLAVFALPPVAAGMADVTAALSARGDSPHALAASLNGTLSVRMAGGSLDAAVLAPLVAHAHLPLATPAGTEPLRCLALGASVRDGHAALDPLVADAGRLAVSGTGTFDLADETLDLHLLPLLRLGPMLTIPLRVAGSWRDPAVASDAGVRGAERADPCEAAGIAAAPLAKMKPPKAADILRGLLRR